MTKLSYTICGAQGSEIADSPSTAVKELQDGDSPALNRGSSQPGALVLLGKVALSVICPRGQEGTAGLLRCSFVLLPVLISAS